MTKKVIERFLSFARYTFFEIISPKFNIASFKNFMDFAYVYFEKFAFSFEVLSKNYLKLYDEIVEKEIKMAHITKKSKVLVVGCGSLPATTALISAKTNAKIVSIDYDREAVQNASHFLKNFTFKSNIKIVYADGYIYPIKGFDVIFILYGIKKQKDILIHLSNNLEDNTRVVFRTTQDSLNQIVGGTKFLSKWFVIKDNISSESIYTSDSYLLMKKK